MRLRRSVYLLILPSLFLAAVWSVLFSKEENPYLIPDLRSAENAADYMMISPEAFLPALLPLAKHREKQGYQAAMVRLEDVGSAFCGNKLTAECIREFIRYAYHNWKQPGLRFLLLTGDAVSTLLFKAFSVFVSCVQ